MVVEAERDDVVEIDSNTPRVVAESSLLQGSFLLSEASQKRGSKGKARFPRYLGLGSEIDDKGTVIEEADSLNCVSIPVVSL